MSDFDLKKMATTIDNLSTTLDVMLCCKDDGGQEISESCEQLHSMITSFDDQMNTLKEVLVEGKNAQTVLKRQLDELKTIEERCNHMIANFPDYSSNGNGVETQQYNQNQDSNEYQGNNLNNVTNISNMSFVSKWNDNCWPSENAVNRTMSNNTMLGKSICSQSTKQVPTLKPVNNSEMDTVPKYMKGRLTSLNVNVVIDGINAALENKYDILRKPKNCLKTKELDMYNTWKNQQNSVGSGQFFVTAEDITKFSETKVDKTTLNIVPILRHLKRLKESRIGGSVYYLPY